MKPTIELLCRLRFEVRDWQQALSGEREGFDPFLAEVDSAIADQAARDGYLCGKCCGEVPHDSNVCPHCGTVDLRACNPEATEAERLEAIAAEHDDIAATLERTIAEGEFTEEGKPDAEREAASHRRAAAIIRRQIECEA